MGSEKITGTFNRDTVPGFNRHPANVDIAALSSIGLPVLRATATLRIKPSFGSISNTNTPRPVMPLENASYGYRGRGAKIAIGRAILGTSAAVDTWSTCPCPKCAVASAVIIIIDAFPIVCFAVLGLLLMVPLDTEISVIRSNENKMSDSGRGRASLEVEKWKSSQEESVRRSGVRSIAWLGLLGETRTDSSQISHGDNHTIDHVLRDEKGEKSSGCKYRLRTCKQS